MNPVPVEMSFLKAPRRENDVKIIEKYAKEKAKPGGKEPILFRTYGWFDALMIIRSPKSRCSIPANQPKNSESDKIMETSFMGWYYERGKYPDDQRTPYCGRVNELRRRLWEITENRECEKIVWEGEYRENGIIKPEGLFILSFIKLVEYSGSNTTESNNQNAVDSSGASSKSPILEKFMIIDYLGLWDIAILAKLRKDVSDSYELLEKYKYKFLVSANEILQSSSIVLTQFK